MGISFSFALVITPKLNVIGLCSINKANNLS
nr:MAG TPA: hypothetical protein [Caudoviricetes sp.]